MRVPAGVTRIDAANETILGYASYTDDECRYPNTATVTAGGGVFLVCEGNHEDPGAVVRLDPATLEVQARVSVGRFPDALAVLEADDPARPAPVAIP